jgi:ABC-2 type transport system ATP-binding protein
MAQTPALKIEKLRKSYGKGAPAVDGLSLEILPGEIFGLLGPNGAGKSTTMNLISGMSVLEQGRIEIFGHDVVSEFQTTRRMTGLMHQEIVVDNFFDVGTALRLHSGYYGLRDDPAWRELLIEKLALGPHLKKKMIRLSGGMKRRFMVAKALIHKPRLLVLDEPTAGVDVELRRQLWDFVREINKQGTTVLLSTHYLEEAEQMCHRIGIMKQGKLVALDTTRNLVSKIQDRQVELRFGTAAPSLPPELAAFRHEKHEDGQGLRLHASSQTEVTEILAHLGKLVPPVQDLEIRRSDLEDVFVKLTGDQR